MIYVARNLLTLGAFLALAVRALNIYLTAQHELKSLTVDGR